MAADAARGGAPRPLADALCDVQSLLGPEPFDPSTSARRFAVTMNDHVAHLMVPELVERMQRGPARPTRRAAVGESLLDDSGAAAGDRPGDLLLRRHAAGVRERRVVRGHGGRAGPRSTPAPETVRARRAFLAAGHAAVVGRGLEEDPVDAWLRECGHERRAVLQGRRTRRRYKPSRRPTWSRSWRADSRGRSGARCRSRRESRRSIRARTPNGCSTRRARPTTPALATRAHAAGAGGHRPVAAPSAHRARGARQDRRAP